MGSPTKRAARNDSQVLSAIGDRDLLPAVPKVSMVRRSLGVEPPEVRWPRCARRCFVGPRPRTAPRRQRTELDQGTIAGELDYPRRCSAILGLDQCLSAALSGRACRPRPRPVYPTRRRRGSRRACVRIPPRPWHCLLAPMTTAPGPSLQYRGDTSLSRCLNPRLGRLPPSSPTRPE